MPVSDLRRLLLVLVFNVLDLIPELVDLNFVVLIKFLQLLYSVLAVLVFLLPLDLRVHQALNICPQNRYLLFRVMHTLTHFSIVGLKLLLMSYGQLMQLHFQLIIFLI